MSIINRTIRLSSTSHRPDISDINNAISSATTDNTNSFRVAGARIDNDANGKSNSEPNDVFDTQEGFCGGQDSPPSEEEMGETSSDHHQTPDWSHASRLFKQCADQMNVFIANSTLKDARDLIEESNQRLVDLRKTHHRIKSELFYVKESCENCKPVNDWITARINDVNNLLDNNCTILYNRITEATIIWLEEAEEDGKRIVLSEDTSSDDDEEHKYFDIVVEDPNVPVTQFSTSHESGDTSSNPNTDRLISWDSTRDEPLPSTGHHSTNNSDAKVFPIRSFTITVETVIYNSGTQIVKTRRPEYGRPLTKLKTGEELRVPRNHELESRISLYKDTPSEDDDDEFFDTSDYIELNEKETKTINNGMTILMPPYVSKNSLNDSETPLTSSAEQPEIRFLEESDDMLTTDFSPSVSDESPYVLVTRMSKSQEQQEAKISQVEMDGTLSEIRNERVNGTDLRMANQKLSKGLFELNTNTGLPSRRSQNSPPDHYRHYNKVRHKDVHQTNTWNSSELEGNETTTPLLISSIHRLFPTTPRDVKSHLRTN